MKCECACHKTNTKHYDGKQCCEQEPRIGRAVTELKTLLMFVITDARLPWGDEEWYQVASRVLAAADREEGTP